MFLRFVASHFVTDGSEAVATGRDDSGGNAAENRYGLTLFGNRRYRLESPSVSSNPGHPMARHEVPDSALAM